MIEIIRSNGVEHIPAIQQIASIAWPKAFEDILSAEQIAYMMNMMYATESLTSQIQEHGHRFLLAKEADVYLGYISYELNYHAKSIVKIHKIYILPNTQGKGVGRLLMSAIAEIGRENNCKCLTLNVNRNNKALHFYEKLGYHITKEENNPIGNGFLMEDFVMEKEL